MPPPERRDSDTPRSYAALCDYAAMGAGRSLRELAADYRRRSVDRVSTGRPPTTRFETLGTWSADHDWQARIQAAEDAERATEEQSRQAIRAARRAELEEQDWATGSDLRRACEAILLEMPRFLKYTETEIKQGGELVKVITLALKAGPGELARALKLASELQRLSVGEPTENVAHSGSIEVKGYTNVSPDDWDNQPPADD